MKKISIITPTIGRESLKITCGQMDVQMDTNFEHVVAFDGSMPEDLPHYLSGRKVVATGTRFNDYGHSVRKFAWDFCDSEYIGYVDDDDYFTADAIEEIIAGLELHNNPTFLFFPALRLGQRFFHYPPRSNMTVSTQYVHKKFDNEGNPIRYTGGGYCHDGEWLDEMLKKYDYAMLDIPKELNVVTQIGHGEK